jgi:hypothetical protein
MLICGITNDVVRGFVLMRSQKASKPTRERQNERGAALITAILLSLLLLAAGGTLVLTTSMTGITALDSTAEMQAYYAAESGMSRTLEVLRGNVPSNPAGTRATFLNVACSRNLWAVTSGNNVNVATDGSTVFRVTSIVDLDDPIGANCGSATYKATRLRIQVAGVGPNNALKNMEMVVNRYTLSYPVNATVTMRNGSGSPINFDLGGSNVTSASGNDSYGTAPPVAAFAVDNSDYNATNNIIDGCNADGTNCSGSAPNVSPADPLVLNGGNTPSFLESVKTAREFLYGSEGMLQAAKNQGRYFTTGNDAIASTAGLGGGAGYPDGVYTFIDGDFTLGPGNPTGQGTLIVTGTLTLNGNFNWNGVIMVLGGGTVVRTGGGNGNIYGAMFVAKFPASGTDSDVFGAPTFNTSGGGTANIQYNSDAIDRAKSVGGHSVSGIREN